MDNQALLVWWGLGAMGLEGQVMGELEFLWNEAVLIILVVNHPLHPGLGFALMGTKPTAAAVHLGFSASGLKLHEYLLVEESRRGTWGGSEPV